jgi:hypothetical protein
LVGERGGSPSHRGIELLNARPRRTEPSRNRITPSSPGSISGSEHRPEVGTTQNAEETCLKEVVIDVCLAQPSLPLLAGQARRILDSVDLLPLVGGHVGHGTDAGVHRSCRIFKFHFSFL